MSLNRALVATWSAFAVAACGVAQDAARRPEWDQTEAVAKVKGVLALEEKGELPWDKVAWETDPKKAVERAGNEQKPIFVYFFLKKNVGPAAAPC